MAAELSDELQLIDRLAHEAAYGDVARAAKLSSADAALQVAHPRAPVTILGRRPSRGRREESAQRPRR